MPGGNSRQLTILQLTKCIQIIRSDLLDLYHLYIVNCPLLMCWSDDGVGYLLVYLNFVNCFLSTVNWYSDFCLQIVEDVIQAKIGPVEINCIPQAAWLL